MAAPLIALFTHHKTGTNLLGGIFRDYAKRLGKRFYDISDYLHRREEKNWGVDEIVAKAVAAKADIVFECCSDGRAQRKLAKLECFYPKVKTLHIQRNPYEVIVSAYRYHLFTDEKWAHQPQAKWKGKSYQQVLSSLDEVHGLLFEMNHVSHAEIWSMYEWDYSEKEGMNLKLEDFYEDFSGTVEKVACFLEIDSPLLLEVAAPHNIWSGRQVASKYITNRTGKKYVYPDLFKETHYEEFRKLFPEDILSKLGYWETQTFEGLLEKPRPLGNHIAQLPDEFLGSERE